MDNSHFDMAIWEIIFWRGFKVDNLISFSIWSSNIALSLTALEEVLRVTLLNANLVCTGKVTPANVFDLGIRAFLEPFNMCSINL